MNDLLATALAAADAAAAVHRRDRGRVVLEGATEKGRSDYVSQTDLDAQKAALGVILGRYPDHQVLGEEDERPLAERMAEWDGRPVAGAVVSGSSGERWWAARGEGAFKDGRGIRVSRRPALKDALVGTGFPFKLLDRLPEYLGQLDRVLRRSSGVRRAGAASLDLCYLAQGSLDAFWELILHPWDFAAGWLLVEEAGGVLVKLDGSPLELVDTAVMGANSPELLEALVGALRDG